MKVNLEKPGYSDGGVVAYFLLKEDKIPEDVLKVTGKIPESEFDGKLGTSYDATTLGKMKFRRVFLVGLGERKEFEPDYIRRAAAIAVHCCKSLKCAELSVHVPHALAGISPRLAAQFIAEGAILSNYKFMELKTKKEEYFDVKQLSLVSSDKSVDDGIATGTVLADAQNYVRELDEYPANIMTPRKVEEAARRLAKESKGVSITVFDENALRKKGMNALLGVARGSGEPPRLVILEYNRDRKNLPLYGIVGKGITFDSGGISLKPSAKMHEMKYDKSGALVALGVLKAATKLNLPIRIIAALALTENMPDGKAQKPGDVIKAYGGKTIEVLNTDAEGRLVLADALAYIAEKNPKAIIDIATLTGAVIVALGRHAIGLFSTDDELAKILEESGKRTYERVWRFPMWKEYSEMMKSDVADIKNISDTGEAGSITGAVFLKEFIGDAKWVHLDIAGVANITNSHPYIEKGASGIGVRLITEALIYLSKR
ncbi:leucyl aminopeptidase [Candidatus Micrarchaeota archaeon]|nr:leucyl aminopeptidase [Candidatus Micrarchaeota archaeon]